VNAAVRFLTMVVLVAALIAALRLGGVI